MYNTMIQPILDYGDIVWGDRFNQTQMDELQVLQNKAAKIILNQPVYSSGSSALSYFRVENTQSKEAISKITFHF